MNGCVVEYTILAEIIKNFSKGKAFVLMNFFVQKKCVRVACGRFMFMFKCKL